jgi:hypothetical protein
LLVDGRVAVAAAAAAAAVADTMLAGLECMAAKKPSDSIPSHKDELAGILVEQGLTE